MGAHTGNARDRIIDAAEQTVIETGARHLTLEAVAKKANISRGGLLYHFSNKESLLMGMLERRMEYLAEKRMKKRAQLPSGKGREAMVYVHSLLDDDAGINRGISAALIASGTHKPELLEPARKDLRRTVVELTGDGLSPERAMVIALATNGLRFLEVLSMSPFNAAERRKIVNELLSLAKEKEDGEKKTE